MAPSGSASRSQTQPLETRRGSSRLGPRAPLDTSPADAAGAEPGLVVARRQVRPPARPGSPSSAWAASPGPLCRPPRSPAWAARPATRPAMTARRSIRPGHPIRGRRRGAAGRFHDPRDPRLAELDLELAEPPVEDLPQRPQGEDRPDEFEEMKGGLEQRGTHGTPRTDEVCRVVPARATASTDF